jgi:hypothetical protein
MRPVRFSFLRREPRHTECRICQYAIGQRLVELVRLSDGCTQWVCNCDSYLATTGSAQGPWCKHVAKAAAIRSIERLTGERVISRATLHPAYAAVPTRPQSETSRSRADASIEAPAGIQHSQA